MIVEKTESVKDIAEILRISDDRLEKQLPCTKGEWVQWLMTMIGKKNAIGVWIAREEENKPILGYVVAVNSIAPPISNSVLILYSTICLVGSDEVNGIAIEKIKSWASELGAKKLSLFTDHPQISRRYGFVESEGIFIMTMELSGNE